MTLEAYLVTSFLRNGAIDHTLRVHIDGAGKKPVVTFYIHPNGKDGDTPDFKVDGNVLETINNVITL